MSTLSMLNPTVTTTTGGLQCVTGVVRLFGITTPTTTSVIGQVQQLQGGVIPLIRTQPTPIGGTSLESVNGQFAQVCGVFVRVGGQVVLDVRLVNPGFPSPTGTPTNINQLLLLLLILIILSQSGIGLGGLAGLTGLSTTQLGQLTPLLTSLQSSGLNINQLIGLLGQTGLGTTGAI
jgi:hypothetical protein